MKRRGIIYQSHVSVLEIAPNVGLQDAKGQQTKTIGEFLQEFEKLDLHSGNEESSSHLGRQA